MRLVGRIVEARTAGEPPPVVYDTGTHVRSVH